MSERISGHEYGDQTLVMEDLEFEHSATESQFKRTIFMISISYSDGMLIFEVFVSEIRMNFIYEKTKL